MHDHLLVNGAPHAVYVVHGEDPSLVAQALGTLLGELAELGLSDPSSVEEYGEAGGEELSVSTVLNACLTPPFLSERRVVVVRDSTVFDAASQRELAGYLASPMATTLLVLAHPGRLPAALARAAQAHGLVIEAEPANQRGRALWVAAHLKDAGLRLDQRASQRLTDHLGEDLARLEGLTATLQQAYGPGATIHEEELEPFLGDAGSVAPWDLTDAIDAGDTAGALGVLHRLLEAGGRHPFQLLAILHRHFGAMLRLDGAEVSDDASAAAVSGLAPFPARKALRQSRSLGHDRVARAIGLLAAADIDLRGGTGLSDQLVMELLVARLAQLARGRETARRARG